MSSRSTRRNSPQPNSSDDMTSDTRHVVVRYAPSTGLESAFRIHVLPETLEDAGLKVGQPCEFSSEDGSVGYGIAWRADDRMGNRPKHRPAKMTETVHSAFGFDEGSRVVISATDIVRPLLATRIVLSDVTPPEWRRSDDVDGIVWKSKIIATFVACEALASGVSFEVQGRKKSSRRRFFIDSIESVSVADGLFLFDDKTTLVFPTSLSDPVTHGVSGEAANGSSGPTSSQIQTQMNTERIGGLLEQCRDLNFRLRRFFEGRSAEQVLIHGYEGTGKTMLLHHLAQIPAFKKVLELNRDVLVGRTVKENQDIIRKSFDDAIANQPSLLLMDDLDRMAPLDDAVYSKTLTKICFDGVKNKRVMIVGATRSITSVHASLLHSGRFIRQVELDVPDTSARAQILNVLRGEPECSKDDLSTRLATRTHGYTGQDLADLHNVLIDESDKRYDLESCTSATDALLTPPAYSKDAPAGPGITESDIEIALSKVRPTALRTVFTEKPKTRWEDIGGSQDLKGKFDKIIGWPLQYKDLLAADFPNDQSPKGILLYGPPGCSKTLTAQAVANMYNLNFIAIKGAELVSMYVGESERAIRDVFRKARAACPCVIFFDEIDAIGSDREGGGTKGLNVLTTLLIEMDGFEVLRDVFILAATNRPEALDPALMRPGRFDSHAYLGLPGVAARKEILTIATRGIRLADDVDLEDLAERTNGYSGAELVRITRVALEPAMERKIANIGRPDEEAVDYGVTGTDFGQAITETRKGITEEMLARYVAFARSVEGK